MTCDQCKLLDLPSKPFIYEDDKVFAMLAPQPAVNGHVLVMPKVHLPILENVADELMAHTYTIANKISMALFDGLQAQGTNVLICNGIAAGQESAHFMVHVIPRMPDDGLGFVWLPRQLTEEQMATIELQLKAECAKINGTPVEQAIEELKEVEGEEETKEDAKKETKKSEEKEAAPEDYDDYQIKHVTRIP